MRRHDAHGRSAVRRQVAQRLASRCRAGALSDGSVRAGLGSRAERVHRSSLRPRHRGRTIRRSRREVLRRTRARRRRAARRNRPRAARHRSSRAGRSTASTRPCAPSCARPPSSSWRCPTFRRASSCTSICTSRPRFFDDGEETRVLERRAAIACAATTAPASTRPSAPSNERVKPNAAANSS